ncbi:MAG: capsule assembly Wzi family protein [Steroidobacteraceae bacterium]
MTSWTKLSMLLLVAAALCGTCGGAARAEGLSAYLPLNLEPEMERQIERVLILADEPILKRPIPVELVKLALPQACAVDKYLCKKVTRYLERYSRDYALTHASATAALTHGANTVLPNAYGMESDSHYEFSAQGFVQPSDYLLATGGVISYKGRTEPTGTALSLGFDWAQLDVGFRDHWMSPMTDSSMIMSTEAPTTPSVTFSNYAPLTRLGFQYEFFLTRLDQTGTGTGTGSSGTGTGSPPVDNILYNGVLSRGNPRLFGAQFSIEPYPGWSLGINRLLEYGGGSRLPDSARFLLRDFFEPSGLSQTQGNQEASYVSRFVFPGKTPFAVYAQYGGEDNSDGGSYLLGNAALAVGIDFPRIGRHFDATYEITEWQNIWYVHNIFLDGMTSNGLVLGNWGADQRNFNDGVGARTQMLRIGWTPPFGGYLQEQVRTLVNQTYYGGDSRQYSRANPPAYPYHHYLDASVTYSRPWRDVTVGGGVEGGRDVYGESFWRLSAFLRYGGDARTRDDGDIDDDDSYHGGANPKGSELFVDAGVNVNKVRVNLDPQITQFSTALQVDPHFGLGARRAVSANNDLGVQVELDEVASHALYGFRFLDYRHRYGDSFALDLGLGVDRYQLATPAYSMYAVVGGQWRNFWPALLPKFDLGLDLRYAQNVARDHVLAADPNGSRADSFYKIESAVFYLSRRF